MNNILLAAALVLAGGAVVMTQKETQATRTPEQAVDLFIRGMLLVDANMIADSLGERQTGEEILTDIWGPLAQVMQRREARDPNEYTWKIQDFKKYGSFGDAKIEYVSPDINARVERMMELMGARYNAEGRLIGYDPKNKLTEAEAARMAREDLTLPKIRYVVPMGFKVDTKNAAYWSVDPASKHTKALLDVVKEGDALESNQQYVAKP